MKILIVEDEIGIANFLQQGLEEEGYTVEVANDGEAGLEKALNQKANIILLDWMLPKMTGLEVCKAIRIQDKTTPILFLTARDTIQETIEGLQAGANDYIKKPFSFDELIERIKVHFRNQTETEILRLGTIDINLAKHLVISNKEEIHLTQREFELLCYLVQNKGKVCTRTQIIEDVWNIHFEYDTGVIDVFINSIRKKLNLNKDEELIKTIRGVGYIANDLN
ncbi:DNA-binding response regulator, OmpR family, contains REC and winged-helix (wHTH) domain [Flavobacterium flevense]|uniref:DNA-binding response regulator n=1 Tax=Flavobacterium flevense TaxID=983 RepID=A0A4Y4AQT2_9FLAO|nr:response regulator transcription factor [Flavobacterium flevense]GEC70555.1 DNA-binding response regulator [Flavobacterium flevense]SHL63456.1 DNA-binding response regulator, OmpR family, contains REC and winged-helix (wHTH) domain [Flavobacterium flevense]